MFILLFLTQIMVTYGDSSFLRQFASDVEITSLIYDIGNRPTSLSQSGYFILVWSVQSQDLANYGIMGQMYDSKGNTYGEKFKISTTIDYPLNYPSVAMQNDGTALVVWQSMGQDGDGFGIYGQFLNMNQKLGGEFAINTYTQGDQMYPTVTSADLYFIVTWQSPDSDYNGIYAKIFNYYGQEFGPELRVNQNQTNDQTHPSVASVMMIDQVELFNTVYFVVTWMSYGAVNDYANGIYAREIFIEDYNGNHTIGYKDEFLVNRTSETDPSFPRIGMSMNNSYSAEAIYVIVWQSDQAKASIFSTLSGPIIEDIQVNTRENKDPNLQFLPSVGMSNKYGFIVAYQMKAYDSVELDIYAQIFDSNGKKTDSEKRINVYQSYDQKLPFVRINENNQIIYTWVSKNFNNSGNAVDFQIFSQNILNPTLIADGSQTNLASFKISKILPFVFKIDSYNKYDWILVKDGNIKINVYDSVLKAFISKFEIANSSNYEEFDISFGSKNNKNYYILVFRNGTDIYAISNVFSQIIKINQNFLAKKPQISVFFDNSFSVVYTCYLANLTTSSICFRVFDSQLQSYDEIFISDNFEYSNQTADDPAIAFTENSLTNEVYVNMVWVSSNATFTKIQGRNVVIQNQNAYFTSNIYEVYENQKFEAIPKIAMGDNRQCFVVWEEITHNGKTEVSIRGQIINSFGLKMSQVIEISSFSELNQLSPSVAAMGQTFFVVWSSFGQDSDGFGIFGQNFDYYGKKKDDIVFINTMIVGDQLYPLIANKIFTNGYDVFWINSNDLSLSSQSYEYQAVTPTDISPFLSINYLGTTKIPQFGEKIDVSEAIFTKDGKYFLAGMINGVVQIYDFGSLFILKELILSNATFSKMIMLNDSAIILDNLCQKMFIINLTNIFNPTLETFSFIETCIIDVTKVNHFLFDVFNSILYFGYNQKICLYNLTNPINGTYDLLKQYEIESNNDLQSVYLHNSSLFCLYSNGTANIFETLPFNNFRLIATQNFGSDIITILWRRDGKRLYLAKKTSFEWYENFNLTFVLKGYHLETQPFEFSISNDSQLLSYIRKNGKNLEYVLLDISNDDYNGVIQIWSNIPQQGPYSSVFHPNNLILLLCETQGMEILRIVKENSTNETPTLSSIKNANYYHDFSNWWIDISPSQQTIYMMDQSQRIVSVNVDDFGSNSLYFNNNSRFFIFPYNSSSSDEKIMIYQVLNETIFQLQSEIKYKNINDYLISKDQNSIYIVLSNKIDNISFISLNISDKRNPSLLVKKNLGISGSALLELSSMGTEMFVSIDQFGLIVLNISDPGNVDVIKKIPNSKHNFSIFIITRVSANDYLIVSDPKKSQFVIYQFNYGDFSLTTMGSVSTSQEIVGFQIFNGLYLIVQLENYQTILYSLFDMFNPKQMASYSLYSPGQPLTRIRMVISTATTGCYFPFGDEAILLYPKQANSLYADMYLIPNSLQIVFQIEFWPLNLDPNTQIKLLQINTANGDSKLVDMNLDKKSMKIYPNTIQNIVDLLQPLTLVYSTNINTEELNSNEINTLIFSNYIDNQLFIKEVDFSVGVSLFDPSISVERINFILSQHYFTQIIYLPVDIFTSSTLYPLNNMNASSQIGNNVFIVENAIDFSLSPFTFLNIYETVLTYSANNLPSWLNFDPPSLRFHGVPNFKDLDKNYTISIIASNGFHETSDSFELKIRYYKPEVKIALQPQIMSDPLAAAETTYFFFKDSFVDPNNDTLSYEVRMTNNAPTPSWIVFDQSNLAFKLNPTDSNIFKTFELNVTAKNKYFSCSDKFSFYVLPSYKYILTLISQILAGILAVIGYFKYKSDVYNHFCKKYYVYSPHEIMFDQFFEQEIYFIKEDLNKAWILWKTLMREKCFQKYNENVLLQLDFKENFSNDLKLANNKNLFKKHHKKKEEIENILLDIDNTIFTVCECFLYHHLMNSHQHIKNIYNRHFRKKNCPKDWYQDYVTFSNEGRDKNIQKFKKVILNKDKIKSQLESVSNLLNENAPSFHLICGMIKADALGIPTGPRKWNQKLEYSRGESCFLDITDIANISFKKSPDGVNYEDIEISNTRNLPSWFDYQIKNGILILQGKPDYFVQGVYNVTLIERKNFRIRWQDIKVVSKKRENATIANFEIEKEKNIMNNQGTEEFIKLEIVEDNIQKK